MGDKREYDKKNGKTINGENIYGVRKACRKYWDKFFIDAEYDEDRHWFIIRLEALHNKKPINQDLLQKFRDMWENDKDRWEITVLGVQASALVKN